MIYLHLLIFQITSRYRKPECMGLSFFWWSYERAYEKRKRNSQFNLHEVEMVVSLCRWLIFNNVDAKKIAVITPYKFQVNNIYCFQYFLSVK